jgi:hypothetical protein
MKLTGSNFCCKLDTCDRLVHVLMAAGMVISVTALDPEMGGTIGRLN